MVTVFLYQVVLSQENLIVRGKNLILSGSGKESTIIDANLSGSGIVATNLASFNYNYGSIENFTVRNLSIVNGIGRQDFTQPDGDNGPHGGAIYAFDSETIYLKDLILADNSAMQGGAVAAQDAKMTIDRVIMKHNTSLGKGSVIWFLAGEFIVNNSLIFQNYYQGDSENFNDNASALAFSGGSYKLINNTIANNHGHPIWAFDQNPSVLLANSILTWHDGQGSRPNFTPNSPVNVYLFNNIIKRGINIGGVFNEYTNVFATANYYFEPSFIDTTNEDYRLSDQSAAISSGRNSIQNGFFNYPSDVNDFFIFEVNEIDIDGNDRINPPNSIVDIGSYENINGVESFQNRKWNVSAQQAYGNGSSDKPFPSINHALNAMQEFGGDTIIVNDGTYNESIHVYGPNGYDHLTIKSINGPLTTIIDAPNADQNALTTDGSSITIDGFTLTGGEGYQGAGGMIKESPILRNLIVTNNHAQLRGGGLLIHGGATLENIQIFLNTCSEQPSYGGWYPY